MPRTTAAEFYLSNYRPPAASVSLAEAVRMFLTDRQPHVRNLVSRSYRRTLEALCGVFPEEVVNGITTEALRAHLEARPHGKKAWNNHRGRCMPLFEWCGQPPRRWLAENPAKAIPTFRIQRRVPEILAAARAAELFAYAETYAGERERGQPGALIPYLAPATFAGLWPSLGDGEIWRVGHLRDLSRVIDLEVGAIRLGPEFTTTGFMRTVTIQPNLTLWLRAYSTKMLGGRHSN